MSKFDFTGTMCARAWAGLEIDARGTFRPCCDFTKVLTDSHGQELNVSTNSIDEAVNSPDLKTLRSQMLAGKQPDECVKCWSEQESGNQYTLRHISNRQVSVKSDILSTDATSLELLGIALGNVCNLKCRICGPWASSSWASDEIKRLEKSNSTWEYRLLKQGAWPSKSQIFWDNLTRYSKDLKEITLYGGEPFMSPEHLTLLSALSETPQSKNLTITYVTNGTIFPAKHIDMFEKFKTVNIFFSIDDVGKRFEYQRKNANWNQVVNNINAFRQISNINCKIHCTVSVFNALYLTDIIRCFEDLWPEIKYRMTVLRLVEYHSILYASTEFKNSVRDRLHLINFKSDVKQQLNQILNLMFENQTNDHHWRTFGENIREFDRFRKENLRDSHPELADLLEI